MKEYMRRGVISEKEDEKGLRLNKQKQKQNLSRKLY